MTTLLGQVMFATSTVQTAGTILVIVVLLILAVYVIANIRAGRDEIGSELEIAANLKPYHDDEVLETKKLDRVLTLGLGGLAILGVGLPAYWLGEDGRHSDYTNGLERTFAKRGEQMYTTGAACNSCHGPNGVGGAASFTILDEDNQFVAQVSWRAPALNTVLMRYDREELAYVIDHGRAFSPMPGWGAGGGGANTAQQIQNAVYYLDSIQLTSQDSRNQVEAELRTQLDLAENEAIDYDDPKVGEALFNLGRESGFAGGAYACGRCHTPGWSIDPDPTKILPEGVDIDSYIKFGDGAGAYGPRLTDIIPRQFRNPVELAGFIASGAEEGVRYGLRGSSFDGMMPGFGDNPNTDEKDDGMYSPEMVEAVANYVATLTEQGEDQEK